MAEQPGGGPGVVRKLGDDALIVFLSDCHIGGDAGRDIFESPDDLAALFAELDRRRGPIELVLAGDFFDCLRVGDVPPGKNRVTATLVRPEYGELFAALRRFAAGKDRRVIYMPGNHDAEVWWNAEIRADLVREGLVHEFLLSYAVAFEAEPRQIVYCEHGNEFDPANLKRDYDDPLDTPLGDHVVTEIIPRLPSGKAAAALQLRQIDHVFPLDTIPQWVAGRLFYTLVTLTIRWLLLPLLVAYVAYEVVAYLLDAGDRAVPELIGELVYDIFWLLLAFAVFFMIARRMTSRSIESARKRPDEAGLIRERLERGEALPLSGELPGAVVVFVSGHTHAPALSPFRRPGGGTGVVVNSGCWLRQLQPLKAHLRAPTVFVNQFVQTHVRVQRNDVGIVVDLWEHPRPSAQVLRFVERIAIADRLRSEPAAGAPPRVRESATVSAAMV
jgi:UDP-2,3-diacylglucosamine pyrophosphatase LpxH